MGIEKGAGGVFETALAAFTLDEVFDRDIVEKLFRDRQDKAWLSRSAAKERGQEERAIGCRFQANRFFPGVPVRSRWGVRRRGGGRRRSSCSKPRLLRAALGKLIVKAHGHADQPGNDDHGDEIDEHDAERAHLVLDRQ